MKRLYALHYLLFVLLFATASACSKDDDKSNAPQPSAPKPSSHLVQVRYSAVGVVGLGGVVSMGSYKDGDTRFLNAAVLAVRTATTNGFTDVGQVDSDRTFSLSLAFELVKTGDKVPAGSYVLADILVDGLVKKSPRIDSTTPNGVQYGVPYPLARVLITEQEW
jgi:hypothetical protein